MAKEVSCGPISFFIKYIEGKDIPFQTWHKGIPYDLKHLNNEKERVEWSVLCHLFKNIKPYFSDEDFKKMGEEAPKHKFNKASLVIIKLLYAKVGLFRFMRDYLIKPINENFNCFDVKFEPLGENGVRQIIYLKEKYEFCREFCFFVYGTQFCLLNYIGHKNFTIGLKFIENGFINEIECPKRKPILARVKDFILFPINARGAAIELEKAHQDLLEKYKEIDKSRSELQKQKTQLETAFEISQVIHKNLELEDTIEAIAQSLVEIASFTYAKIKLTSDVEGNSLFIERSFGKTKHQDHPLNVNIIFGNKKIGEVRTKIPENVDNNSFREVLNKLMPIINMTIDDALHHKTVVDYKVNLEKKVEQRTNELKVARDDLTKTVDMLQKAKNARDHFFANISHEFRTPLTLILGPSNNLIIKENDPRKKEDLRVIFRNANRLNELVDQLLDLSKLESGNMKLKTRPENVSDLLKEILLSFASFAERKKIFIKFAPQEKAVITYLDKDKFVKIISNILSNALKFTAENGQINIDLLTSDEFLRISISDTGIGIPADRLNKVFDRFYQVEYSSARKNEGTGIGLALTKELVELHSGEIEVESVEGKGTTFSIKFPLGKDHLQIDEIDEGEESKYVPNHWIDIEDQKTIDNKNILGNFIEVGNKPSILVVEDNPEVLRYIRGLLENEYRMYEALDGKDGLDSSIRHMPDLIISDIMMPRMDGFQFCKKLKTDERISHIPIILLTARATNQDKIDGYEIGADDYIMKPFDANVLISRVKNLITQREKLRGYFRKEGLIDIDKKNITHTDKAFLKRVNEVISKNLNDPQFGVQSFAESFGLSRVTLHKKLVALVGESPGELIRKIRLNSAANLILTSSNNISEIALEVGYNNPSHFSEAFRKQFGTSPHQYKRNFIDS